MNVTYEFMGYTSDKQFTSSNETIHFHETILTILYLDPKFATDVRYFVQTIMTTFIASAKNNLTIRSMYAFL